MEGSAPWGLSRAEPFVEEGAAAASEEVEDRFLERAAIEGIAVHLWESKTIRYVSTAVPTACKT